MHACIYKNGIHSPKHKIKLPCCLHVIRWENKINHLCDSDNCDIQQLKYKNGCHAIILSSFSLLIAVCTSYLCSFFLTFMFYVVFYMYFLFVDLSLLFL